MRKVVLFLLRKYKKSRYYWAYPYTPMMPDWYWELMFWVNKEEDRRLH